MAADHDKDVEMEMDEKLSSRVNFSTSHVFFPSSLDRLSIDFSDVGRASSLGFMELLGIPDLGPSLFNFSSNHPAPQLDQLTVLLEKTTTSDTTAVNPPATPNTSSITSSSPEAPADEQQPKRARDDNDQVMDKKV